MIIWYSWIHIARIFSIRTQEYYEHKVIINITHTHGLENWCFYSLQEKSVKQKHVHIKVKTVTNAQTTDYIMSISDAAGN